MTLTRAQRLAVLAAAHDAWTAERETTVQPDPAYQSPNTPSQYPEGYVDVSCTPADDEAFVRAVTAATRAAGQAPARSAAAG